jgi:hypothetical protein
MFLAQAYVTYKERLDPSALLVVEVGDQLLTTAGFPTNNCPQTRTQTLKLTLKLVLTLKLPLTLTQVREKITAVIAESSKLATQHLEEAEMYDGCRKAPLPQEAFRAAEIEFRCAFTLSKLINFNVTSSSSNFSTSTKSTERELERLATGLADALTGLGDVHEASAVMKAALKLLGLTKKSIKEELPTSYVEWLVPSGRHSRQDRHS